VKMCVRTLCSILVLVLIGALWLSPTATAQVAGTNVNMVSGTTWPTGDPFLQRQNEPSMAVSTRNPMHILAGANDYRTVDLELALSGGAETGDSWLGLFKSFDGGLTWQSTLLPGCVQQTVPQCKDNGALGGKYQAASDPVVRAGTNGMFYYAGLAFDRATSPTTASSMSSIFVARYNDLNNNENTDPITYIDTHIVATGNSSQFLDKPAMAVDIPRAGASTCSFTANEPGTGPGGGTLAVPQSFAAGNVYIAYTDFLAATKANSTPTHMMFTRSTNCGVTWSTPVQINTGTTTSQGSAIAVNPLNGNVYVAWRQFSSTGVPDAIMVAQSTNAGKSFSAPVRISTFQPFDQGTSPTSFRTNAYPSITTDFFGFVYVAFSARGLTASGDARVVAAGSIDGTHWTPAIMVDNPSQNTQSNPSGRGHQIMPAITFANGRLTLLYYDLRLDHYAGFYTPSATSPTGYGETLEAEGELALTPAETGLVFTNYIDDAGLTLRRHTIDLRVLELGIFPTVTLGPSVSVSQYAYGCCVNPGMPDIEQFKFNVPNLPLFGEGTEPFLGDYIEVVPSPLFVPNGSSWAYNFTPSVNPLFHATWTDNRDVVPPADGNWANYTPAVPLNTPSIFQPGKTVSCKTGQEGMRNQNIYTAQITGGLIVGAPGNAKPLGTTTFTNSSGVTETVPFQRAFAVEAQNVANQQIFVRFTIANQPTGGAASFLQFSQLTTLDLTIPAFSSVSRSVFVTSSNPHATVTVNVAQISAIGGSVVANGLSASAVLNPDATNPTITDPGATVSGVSNPDVTNAEVTNPDITNPDVTNPDVTNPDITNPDITNPDVTNPDVTNVSATNPDVTNTSVANPDVTNPDITNPDVTNPDVTNGAIQDVIYPMTNTGNTTATYTVKTATNQTPPGGIVFQLIVNKLYQTPTAISCQLTTQTHWVTVANIVNPKLYTSTDPNLGNPDITNATPNEASVTLAPGETAYITVRVVNPSKLVPFNPLTVITPVTIAQAVNTQTVLANPGNTTLTAPPVYGQLSILSPATLPATDQADQGLYSFQLQSTGGKPGTDTWSIIGGALPQGMSLSSSGLITGQTGSLGPNSVTIQVADGATPANKASQTFSIPVNNVFLENVPGIINDGVVGQPYVAFPFSTTGGTSPIVWAATGLPPGLSINPTTGQISGTPTTMNVAGSTVQATGTDSALPPVVLSRTFSIRVGNPIVIGPATLPSGTIGVSYSAQLSATGGIGGYVFGPPAPATGVTLQSNGALSITNPQAPTISFSVSVHDSANPNQFASANYTIAFAAATGGNVTFTTQPANSIGEQVLAGSPILVRVADNTNAPIANALVTMSLSQNPLPCSTAVLGGTLAQATNGLGVATFPDLTVNRGQNGFSLLANVQGLTAISNLFNVTGYCDTASMNTARRNHIVIALPNGKILITGGAVNGNGTGVTASAELYDPVAHSFTAISPMNVARADHTLTLLSNGTVLVAGGFNDTISSIQSVEIFDPTSNTFALPTAPMTSPRAEHTATLLPNGKVLIAGGNDTSGNSLASAELYDPVAGIFTASTHTMNSVRQIQHADLLTNGRVLISGGFDTNGNPLASAELYDPIADTFTLTGSMGTARGNHASALLYNGKVLVAGGLAPSGAATALTATAEVYDPVAGTFSPTGSMSVPRGQYFSMLLDDGTIFIGAGAGLSVLPVGANADIFNPASGTFSATSPFTTVQTGQRQAVAPDGTVLLASGVNASGVTVPNSEIFYPPTLTPGIVITTPTTLPVGVQNLPYTQVLLQHGAVGAVTWSTINAPPPGLSLSANGILTGTPTQLGTFSIPVQITDSSTPPQTSTATLSLQIVGPLAITPATLPNAPTNSGSPAIPYSAQIQTTGGAGGALTFSVVSGALPPSITLNPATGALTSSAVTAAPNTYIFAIQAVSAGPPSSTASQQFALTVVPLFAGTTPNTLPAATVGAAYSQNLTSTGGTPPFTYNYSSGNLPPELSVTTSTPTVGLLTGPLTTAGAFSFVIQATDSSTPAQSYTEALSINIAPQQPTNLTATLIAGTTDVILSWTQSSSAGVTGYNLYRGTTSGGPYTLVTSVNAATFGFQDNTITAVGTYFYVVTAAASGGVESVRSNEASIVVP
jgi:hypothetical protein